MAARLEMPQLCPIVHLPSIIYHLSSAVVGGGRADHALDAVTLISHEANG
jgi:hypothetical protein